jgi:7-cyano-7-deazaguanine synthase
MSAIVLLSGGMDSSALLGFALRESREVDAVTINYGQRHAREIDSAAAIAHHFGVRHSVIDIGSLTPHLKSALTSDIEVPDGHYSEESMRITVVPNRNAIMLMCAVGVASSRGRSKVMTAVHAGDHFIYPDCRPKFIRAVSEAARLGTEGMGDVTVQAPFVEMMKSDIVALGDSLGVPWEQTWSCYKGGSIHCGRCGTCVERIEAFILAGVKDPTVYAEVEFAKEKTALA